MKIKCATERRDYKFYNNKKNLNYIQAVNKYFVGKMFFNYYISTQVLI